MKSKSLRCLAALVAAFSLFLPLAPVAAADRVPPGRTLLIGMSAPFSGPYAAYGKAMRHTIEAAFAQVNAQGGIHGRQLRLQALDDAYDPERTVRNTRLFANEQHAFALLGYFGSAGSTQAAQQVAGPARLPLIGAVSGAPALREPLSANPPLRYVFNVRASYADESTALVNHLTAQGIKSIAVLYQNDGYGQAGVAGLRSALLRHQLQPVVTQPVDPLGQDAAQVAAVISRHNPQAVIMIALHTPASAFVRALKPSGQQPVLMMFSPVSHEDLIATLGAEARGIIVSRVVPHPWNTALPVVRDYHKLMAHDPFAPGEARDGRGMHAYYGLEAYLMARTLIEALRRTGRDPTREKLVQALESLQPADLGGYRIHYTPDNHDGSRFVELTVIGPGGRVLK